MRRSPPLRAPARVLISAPGFGAAGGDGPRMLREAGCEIIPNPTPGRLTEDQMMTLVGGVHAVIAGTEPITARVLDAAPDLMIVARRGVGLDSVDLEAATARGVVVTVTAGVLTEAVAEHTFALMLAVARQVPRLDRNVKAGGWDRTPTTQVSGKTLGIVGFGQIGRAVARRAAGFGMRALAYDVAPDPAAAEALGVTLCDLDTLLAASDFVSLHVPLLPATRGLIDEAAIHRMKPGAILINTSRGPIVDERALLAALREGHLAGAGLDVLHDEPPKDLALVSLEQVVATPHVASHTRETLSKMDESCAESVLAVLSGGRPRHVANPEVHDQAR